MRGASYGALLHFFTFYFSQIFPIFVLFVLFVLFALFPPAQVSASIISAVGSGLLDDDVLGSHSVFQECLIAQAPFVGLYFQLTQGR